MTASSSSGGATDKHVAGIITAMEATALTISCADGRKVVTAKVDPSRTKVTVDGRPAKLADLRITYLARADLSLDDVWQNVRAGTK